jgi:hypothetical protein
MAHLDPVDRPIVFAGASEAEVVVDRQRRVV